jgi:hypothetical protein
VVGSSSKAAASADIRTTCRVKNPTGVRLISHDPEKNAQLIAAYLGFTSVTLLKDFIVANGKYTLVVPVQQPC